MAILNQFGLKKPIRATLSNSNFWFKFKHPQSGLTTIPAPNATKLRLFSIFRLKKKSILVFFQIESSLLESDDFCNVGVRVLQKQQQFRIRNKALTKINTNTIKIDTKRAKSLIYSCIISLFIFFGCFRSQLIFPTEWNA